MLLCPTLASHKTYLTPYQEATVSERLKELTDILINKMVVNGSYVFPNYDLNWQPLPADISYGHNIEAAWLVADAIDTLSSAGTINGSTAAQWKSKLVATGSYAAAAGYDPQYSGECFPCKGMRAW